MTKEALGTRVDVEDWLQMTINDTAKLTRESTLIELPYCRQEIAPNLTWPVYIHKALCEFAGTFIILNIIFYCIISSGTIPVYWHYWFGPRKGFAGIFIILNIIFYCIISSGTIPVYWHYWFGPRKGFQHVKIPALDVWKSSRLIQIIVENGCYVCVY